jgi:hypothetical protein
MRTLRKVLCWRLGAAPARAAELSLFAQYRCVKMSHAVDASAVVDMLCFAGADCTVCLVSTLSLSHAPCPSSI